MLKFIEDNFIPSLILMFIGTLVGFLAAEWKEIKQAEKEYFESQNKPIAGGQLNEHFDKRV